MDEYKNWLNDKRKGIEIWYKGVNITDKVGLCVCNDCIRHVKDEIDKAANNCT